MIFMSVNIRTKETIGATTTTKQPATHVAIQHEEKKMHFKRRKASNGKASKTLNRMLALKYWQSLYSFISTMFGCAYKSYRKENRIKSKFRF